MGKSYTEEYKAEAVKLMEEIGRSAAIKRLGISEVTAGRWMRAAGKGKKLELSPKASNLATENRELKEKLREMEREIARIKKENEFLEEAASFFAVSRQKSKQSSGSSI